MTLLSRRQGPVQPLRSGVAAGKGLRHAGSLHEAEVPRAAGAVSVPSVLGLGARKLCDTKANRRPSARTAAFGMAADPSHPYASPPSAGCRAAMPRSGPGAAGCSRRILGGAGRDERAALPAALNREGRGVPRMVAMAEGRCKSAVRALALRRCPPSSFPFLFSFPLPTPVYMPWVVRRVTPHGTGRMCALPSPAQAQTRVAACSRCLAHPSACSPPFQVCQTPPAPASTTVHRAEVPGAPLLLQADRGHPHRHLPHGDAGDTPAGHLRVRSPPPYPHTAPTPPLRATRAALHPLLLFGGIVVSLYSCKSSPLTLPGGVADPLPS